MAPFDAYAAAYDAALAEGLSVTGEDKDYFARGRIAGLARALAGSGLHIRRVLDYGCGTGTSAPLLLHEFHPDLLIGVDVSSASLAEAEAKYGCARMEFHLVDKLHPNEDVDLAYCNGVFHHIPWSDRAAALRYIAQALRPGGVFAFWENNPWNPGTRWVMRRTPFDRDAVPLSAPTARSLIRAAGLAIERTEFAFIFPRSLRRLRWLEPHFRRLPLGGQYLVLSKKPQSGPSTRLDPAPGFTLKLKS